MSDVVVRYRDGPPRANGPCILFVHGFTGSPETTWAAMACALAEDPRFDGWNICGFRYQTGWRIDWRGLWSSDAGLEEIAIMLRTELETGAIAGAPALILVAHSMGGLIAQRALVASRAIRRRTDALICFGTPSDGLAKAKWGSAFKGQARDMARNSPFIRTLRLVWEREIGDRPEFRCRIVAGEKDQFVPPESSQKCFPEPLCAAIPGDHLSMIDLQKDGLRALKEIGAIVLAQAPPHSVIDSARLAVERGNFKEVVEQLWEGRKGLDDDARVLLAMALTSLGRDDDALEVVRVDGKLSTELQGVLAGRLKRRWWSKRQKADGEAALTGYRAAFEQASGDGKHGQAYYNGINVAFLEGVLLGDQVAARTTAARVLAHCQAERDAKSADLWTSASEGEAHLYLGDIERAAGAYERFVGQGPKPWQIWSAYQQAGLAAEKLLDKEGRRRLLVPFERKRPATE